MRRKTIIGRREAALAALAALSACGGAAVEAPHQAVNTAAPRDPARTPPAPAARQVNAALTVDAEGLRVVNTQTGATTPLSFGAPQAQVLTAVERLRGPAVRARNGECDFDVANWTDGLGLTFRGGRFLGWTLGRSATDTLTTMSGVGVGSTRQALEDSYTASVSATSLGTEFRAGGLSGLLDGTGPTAAISYMWAGEVCLAR